MINKGTLELVVDGAESEDSDEFTYRLEAQPGPKSAWEQALCDVLPLESLDGSTLRLRLNAYGRGVRRHLRKHLEDRGLVSPPQGGDRRTGLVWPLLLGVLLMWIGILFSMWWVVWNWLGSWGLVWWPGMVIIGVWYSGAISDAYDSLKEVRGLTKRGRTEIGQWRRFGEYLGSLTFRDVRLKDPDGTDPLLSYAFALNRMDSWNRISPQRGPLPENSAPRSGEDPVNAKKLGLDAAMLISVVAMSGEGTDLDLDFDLSI